MTSARRTSESGWTASRTATRTASRTVTRTVALAALLLAGCSAGPSTGPAAGPTAESAPESTAGPTTPAPAPEREPDPASTETGEGERPPIETINPGLGWPFAADLERMLAFPALLAAAFDAGSAEGLRFFAEHSWPDGYTADALLACRTPEPTPTYAELDASGWRYHVDFTPISPAPGFEYPPTGQYPAQLGLRVYLGRLRVVTEEDGAPVHTFDDIGRLAVRPDGAVVLFPTCFPFLPGQVLEHRVTDGTIGGYTDAEAEGDIRLIFTSSPPQLQAEVCERLAARDFDALEYMIMPFDIEFTEASIPRHVMERTVTELCMARLR